jgi:3-oxoacyl-[acyl-carrier-protein] synthase-3
MIKANESVRVAVRRFAEAAEEAAAFNGISLSEVKWVVPHQANLRILQQVAKRLGVPFEKVYLTIEKYGNISSATIPIALDEAVRSGSRRSLEDVSNVDRRPSSRGGLCVSARSGDKAHSDYGKAEALEERSF